MYRLIVLVLVVLLFGLAAPAAQAQAPSNPPPSPQIWLTKGPWFKLPDSRFQCRESSNLVIIYEEDLIELSGEFVAIDLSASCVWLRLVDLVEVDDRWRAALAKRHEAESNLTRLEDELNVEWTSWKFLDLVRKLLAYQSAVAALEEAKSNLELESERLLSGGVSAPQPTPSSTTTPQSGVVQATACVGFGKTLAQMGSKVVEVPPSCWVWISSDPAVLEVGGNTWEFNTRWSLVAQGPLNLSISNPNPKTTYVVVSEKVDVQNCDGAPACFTMEGGVLKPRR